MMPMMLLAHVVYTQYRRALTPFRFFTLTIFMVSLLALLLSFSSNASVCSENWKITGYYSPIESDFPYDKNASVMVQKQGPVAFNATFLKEVKMEGWGRTRYGWYLGYFSRKWHKSENPLDARGQNLKLGAVAIDRQYLKMGNKISIPQVNDVIGVSWFVASDVGSAIKQKHIDVYTGEGKLAKQTSWKVTGQKQVCITRT